MIRKSIIALTTLALVAGASLPAMAASGPFGSGDSDQREFAAERILNSLRERGVPATNIEEWGDNTVRAFVRGADGKLTMQYYDVDSFAQVKL